MPAVTSKSEPSVMRLIHQFSKFPRRGGKQWKDKEGGGGRSNFRRLYAEEGSQSLLDARIRVQVTRGRDNEASPDAGFSKTRAAWGLQYRPTNAPTRDQADEEQDGVQTRATGDPSVREPAWESQGEMWERMGNNSNNIKRGTNQDMKKQESSLEDTTERQAVLDAYRYGRFDKPEIGYLREEITLALLRKEPDRLIRAIYASTTEPEFMKNIPHNTFSEMIALLHPNNIVRGLLSTHDTLSAKVVEQLRVKRLESLVQEYLDVVFDVVLRRRKAGCIMSRADYATLLTMARITGSRASAKALWRLMNDDDITPNTVCYNQYLAAIVWHDLYAGVRHKSRVKPFFTLARSSRPLGASLDNYKIGQYGLKRLTMAVFNEMLRRDVRADEETFCTVISGLARHGDVDGLESILDTVWGIDVGAIMSGKESEPATKMKKSSLLYPSNRLMYTIAHAFGINNDIPKALRVVDYILRHFEVRANRRVWEELFSMTFVLSAPRTSKETVDVPKERPVLPIESVNKLWNTMIAPPYSIAPSVKMYDLLIKNLFHRHRPQDMLERMHEARRIYLLSRLWLRAAFRRLHVAVEEQRQGLASSTPIEVLQRTWDASELKRRRNVLLMKRWLRLLLASTRMWARTGDTTLSHVMVPHLLESWHSFAPSTVRYHTADGVVEIVMRRSRQIIKSAHKQRKKYNSQSKILSAQRRYLGHNWVRSRFVSQRLMRRDRFFIARQKRDFEPFRRERWARAWRRGKVPKALVAAQEKDQWRRRNLLSDSLEEEKVESVTVNKGVEARGQQEAGPRAARGQRVPSGPVDDDDDWGW